VGADGGINWVRVTGDKGEFYSLIRPLHLLWYSASGGSSCYDDYHHEYIEKYDPVPKAKDGFYEVSTYGSFNRNDGMDDLRELIRELRWYRNLRPFESNWGDANPLELTWLEMLVEYYTADYWKDSGKYWLPIPMRLMLEHYDWVYDQTTGKLRDYDDPILHITLGAWLERILKVIDVNSFGCIETWT
jgi:hypothetical protein